MEGIRMGRLECGKSNTFRTGVSGNGKSTWKIEEGTVVPGLLSHDQTNMFIFPHCTPRLRLKIFRMSFRSWCR
jgi:hypothetical protein